MATIQLKNVRLAFPNLFEATSVNGSEPSYSATFILPPDHPQIAEINKAIDAEATAKWGAKGAANAAALRAADKVCLHNGDTKADYAGFAGNLFINARNKVRPTIVDRDRSPLTIADGRPYGGCYVNAIVDIYAQDNNFGKRINASLKGVQFAKDGLPFSGGGVAAADAFDVVPDTDTDDML